MCFYAMEKSCWGQMHPFSTSPTPSCYSAFLFFSYSSYLVSRNAQITMHNLWMTQQYIANHPCRCPSSIPPLSHHCSPSTSSGKPPPPIQESYLLILHPIGHPLHMTLSLLVELYLSTLAPLAIDIARRVISSVLHGANIAIRVMFVLLGLIITVHGLEIV